MPKVFKKYFPDPPLVQSSHSRQKIFDALVDKSSSLSQSFQNIQVYVQPAQEETLPPQEDFNLKHSYQEEQLAEESPIKIPMIVVTNPPPQQETIKQSTVIDNDELTKLNQEMELQINQFQYSHRVHTKQFIQLMVQTKEITQQIINCYFSQILSGKINMLENLILQFAHVLPTLESQIVIHYVEQVIKYSKNKLQYLIDINK